MRPRLTVLLLLAFGCGGAEEPRPSEPDPAGARTAAAAEQAWGATRATQARKYQVSLEVVPEAPPMGELFTVRANLRTREGEPVETARVALDARMPQHDHGMMTDPIDDPGTCDDDGACRHPGGIYETEGFKFHMAGKWTVTVTVLEGPRGPDNTSFVYDMP